MIARLSQAVAAARAVPIARVSPARPPDEPGIAKLWDGADADRLAELYLYSRDIRVRPKPLPAALRGHKRVWCSETREHRPAVLAAVSAPDGAITALQRIWVDSVLLSDAGVSPPKGTRSSDLKAGKKTLGHMGSGAVRLAAPGPILGIAEGVESALSATQLFALPCWAALGSRLGAIELPDIVNQVIIFGDNGAAGERAAAAAVSAYRRRGYTAEAVFPERGSDFNELLVSQ